MGNSSREKKWMKWGNELYYNGPGRGEVRYIIDPEDVEIMLNKEGEVTEIRIKNIDKYLDPEEIKEISYEPPELDKNKLDRRNSYER